MAERIMNSEEVIAVLHQVAKEKGDDYRLRISVQPSASALPRSALFFDHVTVENIVYADAWLGSLLGGGGSRDASFVLTAFHMTEMSRMVASPIKISAPGELRWPIDKSKLDSTDWQGPRTLHWESDRCPIDSITPKSDGSPYAAIASSTAPTGAPQSPGVGAAGRGVISDPWADRSPISHGPASEMLQAQLAHEREARAKEAEARVKAEMAMEFERRERAREAQQAKEREEANAQVRRAQEESRAAIAASQAETRELVRKLTENPAKQVNLVETITAVVAAVGPMISKFMETSQAARASEAAAMRELAAAERESARETAKAQAEFVKTILAKDDGASKVVTNMAEAMGSTTQILMQAMTSMAEVSMMGREPEEPNSLKFVREISKGIAGLVQASNAQKALPAKRPNGASNGQANVPTPTPVAAQPTGMAGVPEPEEPQEEERETIVDEIETMIRAEAPAHDVAIKIMKNLSDPDLQAEIAEHGGDFQKILESRLSEWLSEPATAERRQEYAVAILNEAQRLGQEAGIIN